MSKVITRFPPSPTGYFHIGSARTALFNYLFAASQGGTMYLRFEDTDKARTKKEYEDDILTGLKWLNIPYEVAKPMHQSEKTPAYTAALKKLIDSKHAYVSEEPKKDDPTKTVSVVRLTNSGRSVTFSDIIRGEVTFDTKELGDFVIARGTDDPLYHLTVVVDDADMSITHVIRGEDHISNTARQILILEALGFTRPIYAHIPLILAPDRSKLSKRHGAVSINEYRAQGYLPEAIVNYLALLGWNPGGEQEIFSMKELVETFSLERVHKGGAVFDVEKLTWLSHEHLKKLSDEAWANAFQQFSNRTAAEARKLPIGLLKERARTFKEAEALIEGGEFAFLADQITYESTLLIEGSKTSKEAVLKNLSAVHKLLNDVSEFSQENVKGIIFPYAEKEGKSQVLWPLRVALSGQKRSPDPFTLAQILGKEKTISRVLQAIEKLKLS